MKSQKAVIFGLLAAFGVYRQLSSIGGGGLGNLLSTDISFVLPPNEDSSIAAVVQHHTGNLNESSPLQISVRTGNKSDEDEPADTIYLRTNTDENIIVPSEAHLKNRTATTIAEFSGNVSCWNNTRVIIDGHKFQSMKGGPEALLQLALAFQSFTPTYYYFAKDRPKYRRKRFRINGEFLKNYGRAEMYRPPLVGHKELRKGDILIIPEVDSCPKELVRRGVHVYIWLLRTRTKEENDLDLRLGCQLLSHTFWASHANDVQLPRNRIIRSYITPQVLAENNASVIDESMRHPARRKEERLVLLNHEVTPVMKIAIEDSCIQHNCTVIQVKGFTRLEVPLLLRRATMLIEPCMMGSERTAIEAVIQGTLLLTQACETALDPRDFPLPQHHLISNISGISSKMRLLLDNYENEWQYLEEMRTLYRYNVSRTSMEEEAKNFFHSGCWEYL
mmetsp:Transcript_22744/g.37657  ORF Transcript_22744/g.37657 Transcript_22744/m.37657 type:complete len:447 (+) Transcript_22744:52-1392(+)